MEPAMTRRVVSLIALGALLACADRTRSADTAAIADTTPAAIGQTTTSVAGGAVQSGLLDPNTATREQLMALPLDSAAAAALIARRPYADMLAVDSTLSPRMNDAQRKALYAKLFKPIDLNTAKAAEILLIPGVGRRMQHEFEEYRPYTSIEQFRREIGKYVDKNEVARLEQYVRIK
jgi:DNA uptake protein ComE-like DNA-binding protein